MRFNLEKYIFPKGLYCVVCGKYIDDTRQYCLCDHCIKRMNFGCSNFDCSPFFDYGFAAMGYGLYERRLIFNLKYDGKTYMAPILADIIYDAMYSLVASGKECPLLDANMIVPVPLHQRRLSERGFNQSEKIAKHLGRKLSIPTNSKVLQRVRDTHTQRALSADERTQNLEGAFQVPESMINEVQGKKIIILDDIYTTGVTAISCAKALRKAGAKKIYVVTLLFAGNRHHLMVE